MKTCTICKKKRQLRSFNKKSSTKDGFQNICRNCNKIKCRKYYNSNKEHHRQLVYKARSKYRNKNKEFLKRYKKLCSCKFCKESEPICLDFHHLYNKKYLISSLVFRTTSLAKLKEEIRKCIVLCSNCHRKLHAGLINY